MLKLPNQSKLKNVIAGLNHIVEVSKPSDRAARPSVKEIQFVQFLGIPEASKGKVEPLRSRREL